VEVHQHGVKVRADAGVPGWGGMKPANYATLTSAAFEVGLATISHRITYILTACQAREIYDSELSAAIPAKIEMPSHELQWKASQVLTGSIRQHQHLHLCATFSLSV